MVTLAQSGPASKPKAGIGMADARIERIEVEGPKGPLRLRLAMWGSPDAARSVICVHGLTRNARDFDPLAEALAERARVLCPDMPGRGGSDWLADPSDYELTVYADIVADLLQRLEIGSVDWIGTSMGGLIGMLVAARAPSPVRRLVLNDVGPLVPQAALAAIADYVGRDPRFDDLDALERHLRMIHAGFGDLDDRQWRRLARHSARPMPDGLLALAYDPRIASAFRAQAEGDLDLFETYDRLRCPTLVLRGETSPLLTPEIAQAMHTRGPRAELVEIAGAGHAPALMAPSQIALLRDWLDLS